MMSGMNKEQACARGSSTFSIPFRIYHPEPFCWAKGLPKMSDLIGISLPFGQIWWKRRQSNPVKCIGEILRATSAQDDRFDFNPDSLLHFAQRPHRAQAGAALDGSHCGDRQGIGRGPDPEPSAIV